MIQEIINKIEREIELRKNMPHNYEQADICYGLNRAKDIVSAMSEPRWIPVGERTPGEDGDYLVTLVTPGFLRGQPYTNWLCWDANGQEWTDMDGDIVPEQDMVVAWRPIPEPYRPEALREA